MKTGLPDIITFNAYWPERVQLENAGMVLSLEALSKEHAPDLYVPQSMVEWFRNQKDNNWYAYANYYYGNDNVAENNGFFEAHNANFARKDILERLSMTLDDMRTKEGFLSALRAVRDQKVQYNGIDMIPYIGLFQDRVDRYVALQMGASEEDAQGNFQSIYTTPQYEEAILMFNQMYNEGLLTDESFTAKKDDIGKRVASGQLFAATTWTNVSSYRGPLYHADNAAQMLYAGVIQGENAQQVAIPAHNDGGWTGTLITKNTKHPDRAIQLFSWLSQKEMQLEGIWGPNYVVNAEGKIDTNPEIRALSQDNPAEYAAKYSQPDWLRDWTLYQGKAVPEPAPWDDGRTSDDKIIIYDDKPFSAINPEGGTELASIQAKIEQYKLTELVNVIKAKTREASREALKNMLEEMNKLGLGELTEYQNTRFQENKTKLGLTFANPLNAK